RPPRRELSMRRLARRLGVAPKALYTHVRDKADHPPPTRSPRQARPDGRPTAQDIGRTVGRHRRGPAALLARLRRFPGDSTTAPTPTPQWWLGGEQPQIGAVRVPSRPE